MRYFSIKKYNDLILLASRILLMLLFVIFGYQKLIAFDMTTGYMASMGVPMPTVATIVAVLMELVVGIAIAIGFYTRPLALVIAIYTFVSALIGHPFWTMTGMDHYMNEINFYKNIGIVGGLILLALTGPGKFSLDRQ